jgi:hypothetical protein
MIASSRKVIKNYTALAVTQSAIVGGSSGATSIQIYEAADDVYYPDYELVPLTLLPQISIVDRDEILSDGIVNESLYDIVWTIESTDSSKNGTITNGVGGYEIETSGDTRGALYIKSNVLSGGERITYKFTAKYADTRTGQTIRVQESFLVQCLLASDAIPELELDKDLVSFYNPLHHEADITVNAQLYLGDKGVALDDNVEYVWFTRYDDKTPSLTQTLGSDTRDNYVCELSEDGKSVKIHRDCMGDIFALRCVAKYKAGEEPSEVELADTLPTKTIFIHRDLGNYNVTIMDCPTRIQPDAEYVPMRALISDSYGDVSAELTDKIFDFQWGLTTDGESLASILATGREVSISTENMTDSSMFVAVNATDNGAYEYAVDESGDYFVDENGDIMICN